MQPTGTYAPVRPAPDRRGDAAAPTTDQPLILVIDDEKGPRESLRFIFKKSYQVICANSVDEGLQVLRSNSVDVIVLDIKMPGRTGIEGLGDIRAIDPLVSVIMLTGFGSLETAQKAIRLGANDYIKKPFDMIEIREAVAHHIERTRAERQRNQTLNELLKLNRELEAASSEQNHMAQLGQASSEFVHDLRNPLTVICGYAQILQQELDELGSTGGQKAAELKDYLKNIENSAIRCQEMSQTWRDLSTPGKIKREPVLIDDLIRELVATSLPLDSINHLMLDLPNDDSPTILGDPLQLSRALQNLISNALQALPEEDPAGRVVVTRSIQGANLIISVRDNGSGIPEALLDDIFKPKVSTRSASGGMGLGLFITQQIAYLHNGDVTLENRTEGGAEARLTLPLVTAAS